MRVALALLVALIATPLTTAFVPRTEDRPYNAGQGILAACPTDWPIPSVGGTCFLLDGSETFAAISIHDSTFGSGVAGSVSVFYGAFRVDSWFCDNTFVFVGGADTVRVWVGAVSEAFGILPCTLGAGKPAGAATTGNVQIDFT